MQLKTDTQTDFPKPLFTAFRSWFIPNPVSYRLNLIFYTSTLSLSMEVKKSKRLLGGRFFTIKGKSTASPRKFKTCLSRKLEKIRKKKRSINSIDIRNTLYPFLGLLFYVFSFPSCDGLKKMEGSNTFATDDTQHLPVKSPL